MDPSLALPAPLAARYHPLRLLGEGGFGRVLLCDDRTLGRPVALKLLQEVLVDQASRERFRREALLTSRIRHPGVVQVYDHGVDPEGAAWIAYEFVPGTDLASLLARQPGRSEAQLIEWGRQLAAALGAAHAVGVVHRDVKPQNVLVADTGRLVLCDFGIARPEASKTVFTADGLILGTPPFLAPELWLGGAPSPASDQFAFASTLWLAAYGSTVYGSDDPHLILDWIRSGKAPEPPPVARGAFPVLEPILRRGLEREPARRWASMAEVAGALQGAVGSAAPPVPGRIDRLASTRLVARPAATRPGAALAGLVLLVGVGWLGLRGRTAPEGPRPPELPSVRPAGTDAKARDEAAVDLDTQYETMRDVLRDFSRRRDEEFDRYLDRAAALLAEEGFARQIGPFTANLVGWLGAFQPKGCPAPEAIYDDPAQAQGIDRALGLLYDIWTTLVSIDLASQRDSILGEFAGGGTAARRRTTVPALNAYAEAARVALKDLDAAGLPSTSHTWMLQACLAPMVDNSRTGAVLTGLHEAMRSARRAGLRNRLGLVQDLLLRYVHDRGQGAITVPLRRRVLAGTLELLEGGAPPWDPRFRALFLGGCMREGVRLLASALEEKDPQHARLVRRALEDLRGCLAPGTAWEVLEATRDAGQMSVNSIDRADPEIEPVMVEIKVLRDQAKAMLAEPGAVGESQGAAALATGL